MAQLPPVESREAFAMVPPRPAVHVPTTLAGTAPRAGVRTDRPESKEARGARQGMMAFVRAAETRSFTLAARGLGVTASGVGGGVAARVGARCAPPPSDDASCGA